jgi:hypothetical protein
MAALTGGGIKLAGIPLSPTHSTRNYATRANVGAHVADSKSAWDPWVMSSHAEGRHAPRSAHFHARSPESQLPRVGCRAAWVLIAVRDGPRGWRIVRISYHSPNRSVYEPRKSLGIRGRCPRYGADALRGGHPRTRRGHLPRLAPDGRTGDPGGSRAWLGAPARPRTTRSARPSTPQHRSSAPNRSRASSLRC